MLKRALDQAYRIWSGDLRVFGAPAMDEFVASRVRVEQIDNVLRFTSATMMANIFNSLVLVVAEWGTEIAPQVHLWAFALITSCMFLYLRRRSAAVAPKPKTASPRVIRRSAVYALVIGILWALAPILFFEQSSYQAQLVIICLCTGMVCGGAFALATIPIASIAFTSPIVVGFAIAVLQMQQPIYLLVAALTLVYSFVLVRAVATHTLQLVQRVIAQLESEQAAHTDSLTNLPNRVAFREGVTAALSRLTRYGEGFGLLYIDIDDFKSVNDRFGHAAGDQLLIQAADRMKACTRDVDLVARLSGDEFAIIAASVKEPGQVLVVAERLVRAFSSPFFIAGEKVTSRISVGIAIAPSDGIDTETLLKKADMALYSSKRDRRGLFQFFQPQLDELAQQKRAMEKELRQAIANGELEIAYQPFIRLSDAQVSGFEALVRWNHPERGPISPAEFIPISENTGLIQEIGEFVLGESLRTAAKWPDHLRVAVNFSPMQLRSMSIVALISGLLRDSGVAPSRLEVEITESAAIVENDLAISILKAIRALGVRVALDDFGTGYSSLNYLRKLPLDRIKLDRAFTSDMVEHPDCASIVKAVITLAYDLGLAVTAEGVETEEQRNFLTGIGCEEAQGYLIARPGNAKAALAFVREAQAMAA